MARIGTHEGSLETRRGGARSIDTIGERLDDNVDNVDGDALQKGWGVR